MSETLPNSQNLSVEAGELFNQQWEIYQKVLNHNYMGHREIYAILHDFLVNGWKKPFSMLELGCGDASYTAQALVDTNIASYQGIDLSQVALEIARQNLEAIACPKTLIEGDLCNFAAQLAQERSPQFDIIMTSFALHHLDLAQKDALICDVSHYLKPDGVFVLIDVVRQEQETREAYIRRYLQDIAERWQAIAPEEYLSLENHISVGDFPETQQTWRELATKHNFSRVECLYSDRLNTSQLLCFYN
jgi:ubiquinone/menaquinone biosynthesis C-methylase UbiE